MVPKVKVAETPVSPITSAGDIEPTLEVMDCPVNPITSAGVIEPTLRSYRLTC